MIAPGKLHLKPQQRAEYGALCAAALKAGRRSSDLTRKKKHWQPPEHIDIDNLDVNPAPAISSRFFCVENWDEKRQSDFLNDERKKKQFSDLELRGIQTSLRKKNAEFLAEKQRVAQGGAPAQRPEDNSLVSTRKCPTRDDEVNNSAPVARFYHREWSGEYRVSIEAFTRQPDAPAAQAGPRFTESLTARAARNIIDSGAYMAACKGGFTTFLTLTFTPEQREKIEKVIAVPGDSANEGEACNGMIAAGPFTRIDWDTQSTIGREVSKFFDALQKKYQRGWTWQPSDEEKADMLPIWTPEKMLPVYVGVKHTAKGPKPIAKKINYCWVAENPDTYKTIENGVGELIRVKKGTNPHVHVLLDWRVESLHFKGWAQQIEKLWGKGYANLQKIQDTRAASTYLMKALGYMTKGANTVDTQTGEIINSQGIIRGNRYGISSGARAPGWECIAEYEAELMSQFVATTGQQIQQKQERMKKAVKEAQEKAREAAAKLARVKNNYKMPGPVRARKEKSYTNYIEKLNAKIKKIREARYSNAHANKYKITFRAKKQVNAFIERAITHNGWKANILEHTKQTAAKEVHQIASWAKGMGGKLYGALQRIIEKEKQQTEGWWSQVMNDPIPADPENLIVIV